MLLFCLPFFFFPWWSAGVLPVNDRLPSCRTLLCWWNILVSSSSRLSSRKSFQVLTMFYVSEFPGKREALLCIEYDYEKVKMKVTQLCLFLCNLMDYTGILQYSGENSLSFLQGIFPIQGSNPGLPHCRWMLYQLSHKGSPCEDSSWSQIQIHKPVMHKYKRWHSKFYFF